MKGSTAAGPLNPLIHFFKVKTGCFLLFFTFFSCHLYAQTNIKRILAEADQLANEGNFEAAAERYQILANYWEKNSQTDSSHFYRYREATQYSLAYAFGKATQLLQQVIDVLEKKEQPPTYLGRVYYQHGSNYVYVNEFEKALYYLDKCLIFENNRPRPDSLYLAKATEWKGLTYSYLGELEKARQLIEEALQIRQQVLAEDAKEIGYNLNSLGLIYYELNLLERADSAYSGALRVLGKHLPPDHTHLSSILSNVSNIKSSLGEFGQARQLLEQAIASNKASGRFYPLLNDYFNLGALWLSLDDYEHALPYMSRALALADSILPRPHYERANVLDGLGGLYYLKNDIKKADSLFRLALEEKLQLLDPQHPEIGRSWYSLGLMAKHMGDPVAASTYFHRSYDLRKKSLGIHDPSTADALNVLGELDWENGNYQ